MGLRNVTQETAKERIYREFIETIATDKQGLKVIPLSELSEIAQITLGKAKATHTSAVEKLQEQLNTAKKALTEITNIPESDNYFDCEECIVMMEESAKQALAAIGGDDEL